MKWNIFIYCSHIVLMILYEFVYDFHLINVILTGPDKYNFDRNIW
jgi:hypothetical protein